MKIREWSEAVAARGLRVGLGIALTAALSGNLIGCANTPAPHVVRVNDAERITALAEGQPLIIEFHEGDTLPLDFVLEGPLLESAPEGPAILLTAKRKFFLRIDEDGLASSLDGKDFSRKGEKPGSFQIGIGATRERGTRASVVIRGPEVGEAVAEE